MKKVVFLAAAMVAVMGTAVFAQEKTGIVLEVGVDFDDILYSYTNADGDFINRYGREGSNPTIVLPHTEFSHTSGMWTFEAEGDLMFHVGKPDEKTDGTSFPYSVGNWVVRTTLRPVEVLYLYGELGDGEAFGLGAGIDIMSILTAQLELDWLDLVGVGGNKGFLNNPPIRIKPKLAFNSSLIYAHAEWTIANGIGYVNNKGNILETDKDGSGTRTGELKMFVGDNNNLQLRVGANLGLIDARITADIPLNPAAGVYREIGAAKTDAKQLTGLELNGVKITPRVKLNFNDSVYAYVDVEIDHIGALDSDLKNSNDKKYTINTGLGDDKIKTPLNKRVSVSPAIMIGYKL